MQHQLIFLPMSAPNLHLLTLVDDLWVKSFVFLVPADIIRIQITCKHFHTLTNCTRSKGINQYWKQHSICLCSNVLSSKFRTNNWYAFYKELVTFLLTHRWGFQDDPYHSYTLSSRAMILADTGIKPKDITKLNYKEDLYPLLLVCQVDLVLIFSMLIDEHLTNPSKLMLFDDSNTSYSWVDINQPFNCPSWWIFGSPSGSDGTWRRDENGGRVSITLLTLACLKNATKMVEYIVNQHPVYKREINFELCVNTASTSNDPLLLCLVERSDDNYNYNYSDDGNGSDSKDNYDDNVVDSCRVNFNFLRKFLNHSNMTAKAINMTNTFGATAFYVACRDGKINIVKMLIEDKRTDLNIGSKEIGHTPLMALIQRCRNEQSNHFKTFQLLMKHKNILNRMKQSINYQNEDEHSALTFAVTRSNDTSNRLTQMLLNVFSTVININLLCGAYTFKPTDKETPLDLAIRFNNSETAGLLLKYGAKSAKIPQQHDELNFID